MALARQSDAEAGGVKRQCAESAHCRQMPSFTAAGKGGLLEHRMPDQMGSDLQAMDKPTPELPNTPNEGRLDSWKKIAVYLKRDITTVQRWEKREGMPVHRHLHDKWGRCTRSSQNSMPGCAAEALNNR